MAQVLPLRKAPVVGVLIDALEWPAKRIPISL